MIDIHSHILNNIDDGATTLEMSLSMCQAAFDAGTRAMIATPHFMEGNYDRASKNWVYLKVKELNRVLAENKVDITVYPGCEAFISLELPDLLASGKCATLNGSQYLLVELPMYSMPLYTDAVLDELELQGITTVLAHPERYSEIINDPKLINKFLDNGILIQINAGSITGRMGKRAQATAWELLNKRVVHFVSSDTHNLHSRKPSLKTAYNMVAKRFGKDNADLLFSINPESIIKNESIQEMLPFDKNPLRNLVFPLRRIIS